MGEVAILVYVKAYRIHAQWQKKQVGPKQWQATGSCRNQTRFKMRSSPKRWQVCGDVCGLCVCVCKIMV